MKATIYYLPGTSGWGPTFGGRPTMPWNLIRGDLDGDGDPTADRMFFRLALPE